MTDNDPGDRWMRGTLTEPNESPAVAWLRVICSGRESHPVKRLVLLSWADDGAGWVVHLRKSQLGRPINAGMPARTIIDDTPGLAHHTIDRKCPLCPQHWKRSLSKLGAEVDPQGLTGRLAELDASTRRVRLLR